MGQTMRCLFYIFSVGVLLGGCTGLPQPIPIPHPTPDVSFLRSEGLVEQSVGETLIVGLPGVVNGAGRIIVESHVGEFDAMATEAGTFGLLLEARSEETVFLRFEDSEVVEFIIPLLKEPFPSPPGSPPTPIPPGPLPEVPAITPLGEDRVTVVGLITAESTVIGINLDTGDVAETTSGRDLGSGTGEFRLDIVGQSGHRLNIYQDLSPLVDPWELVVP